LEVLRKQIDALRGDAWWDGPGFLAYLYLGGHCARGQGEARDRQKKETRV